MKRGDPVQITHLDVECIYDLKYKLIHKFHDSKYVPEDEIFGAIGEYLERQIMSDLLHVIYLPTLDVTADFYTAEFTVL